MKKKMKTKEKELYDFKKENETFWENLVAAKSDLKMLSVQVRKYGTSWGWAVPSSGEAGAS